MLQLYYKLQQICNLYRTSTIIHGMKIAFVGKGGSGKSTISGLFVQHLTSTHQHILAVDADINQHFASMIGAEFDSKRALDKHASEIRTYLTGTNTRIRTTKRMIKTTPPGRGSRLVTITSDDQIVRDYGTQFADNGYFFHVGTYQDDGIGMSCYHTSLSILENLLSHSDINQKDEWVIVDMVAGTDAFSGPLHAMFDLIFIVVEPTVESLAVYSQFSKLAQKAGIGDRVKIIANKVEDEDDVAYITQQTGQSAIVSVAYDSHLRKQRQRGGVLQLADEQRQAMQQIADVARQSALHPNIHLKKLHDLHSVFAKQQFTIDKYGDTLGHIDPEFSFRSND